MELFLFRTQYIPNSENIFYTFHLRVFWYFCHIFSRYILRPSKQQKYVLHNLRIRHLFQVISPFWIPATAVATGNCERFQRKFPSHFFSFKRSFFLLFLLFIHKIHSLSFFLPGLDGRWSQDNQEEGVAQRIQNGCIIGYSWWVWHIHPPTRTMCLSQVLFVFHCAACLTEMSNNN